MIDYTIDPDRRLVITRAGGRISLTDLAVHLARLLRDTQFKSDYNAIIVAEDVEALPSAKGITTVAPLVRGWSRRRAGAKWAFVVPTPAAHQAAELGLAELNLTAVTTKCFLSEAQAMSWIEEASVPTASTAR